ncbi:MAG: dockerin type I domain-containing protein [Bacteriovoracia bacterium]
MKSNFFSSNGQSLISVLVAMGLMGILLATQTQITTQSLRGSKKVTQVAEFQDTANSVKLILAKACTANLGGTSFAGASGTAPPVPGTAAEGDINGDGLVGSPDLALMLGAWNATGPSLPADLNHDGRVGSPDLAVLLGNWNRVPTSPGGTSSGSGSSGGGGGTFSPVDFEELRVGSVSVRRGRPLTPGLVLTTLRLADAVPVPGATNEFISRFQMAAAGDPSGRHLAALGGSEYQDEFLLSVQTNGSQITGCELFSGRSPAGVPPSAPGAPDGEAVCQALTGSWQTGVGCVFPRLAIASAGTNVGPGTAYNVDDQGLSIGGNLRGGYYSGGGYSWGITNLGIGNFRGVSIQGNVTVSQKLVADSVEVPAHGGGQCRVGQPGYLSTPAGCVFNTGFNFKSPVGSNTPVPSEKFLTKDNNGHSYFVPLHYVCPAGQVMEGLDGTSGLTRPKCRPVQPTPNITWAEHTCTDTTSTPGGTTCTLSGMTLANYSCTLNGMHTGGCDTGAWGFVKPNGTSAGALWEIYVHAVGACDTPPRATAICVPRS